MEHTPEEEERIKAIQRYLEGERLHPKSQYVSRYIVHISPCDGKQYHIEEHIR